MTRNHASAGESVSAPRSQGRRHSAAEMRAARGPARPSRAVSMVTGVRTGSAGDLRPGVHPLLERHTVAVAVAALCKGRLPELDRLEVGVRLVRVQPRAPALLERVHDITRLRVRGCLAE